MQKGLFRPAPGFNTQNKNVLQPHQIGIPLIGAKRAKPEEGFERGQPFKVPKLEESDSESEYDSDSESQFSDDEFSDDEEMEEEEEEKPSKDLQQELRDKYPQYDDEDDDGEDPNFKEPVEIPFKDLEIRPKGIHLYLGMQEKAGKSNMCAAVVRHQWFTNPEITDCIVLCPGGKEKAAYQWMGRKGGPGMDRIKEGNFVKVLDEIIKDNRKLFKQKKNNLIQVVIDDTMGAMNMRSKEGKKIMQRIGGATRHKDINIIFHLCCQNVRYPPPDIRDNVHMLFMGKSSGAQVKKAVDIQDTYDNKRLMEVMRTYGKNYKFVVFDKLKSRVMVTKAPLIE